MEGLGPQHAPAQGSGLPSLSYPIAVPPGRAGLEPRLALQHEPGRGAGLFGLDWTLELPAIERSRLRGLPAPDEPARPWILRGLGRGEELVEVAGGRLRARIEDTQPVFVEELSSGGLRAVLVDGTIYSFGTRPASRFEPGADAPWSASAGAFRLELDAIEDPFGNRVELDYKRLDGSDAPLLASISYNDGHARVRFEYEPRPDLISSVTPGWPTTLAHRVSAIVTEVDGEPAQTTRLTYERGAAAPLSRLVGLHTRAQDGAARAPWTMTYGAGEDEDEVAPQTIVNAPAVDPGAPEYALVDITGDGAPELVNGTHGAWRFRQNLGGFRLDAAWTPLPAAPSAAIGPESRFADLDGDGVEDLLVQPGPGFGELWSYRGGGPQPLSQSDATTLELGVSLASPGLALVDQNGDGHIDLLYHDEDGDDAYLWLRDADDPARFRDVLPAPAPAYGFRVGQPGVSLVNCDGDLIPELARVLPEEGRVLVARGLGLGTFAAPEELRGVPAFDPEDVIELRDLNGDGACDVVRVGHEHLSVSIHQLDGSVSLLRALEWPALDADERVMFTDFEADGTLDVLRVHPEDGWQAWELVRERPGLMTRFENGLGYSVAFEYSAAAALAADDAERGAPWDALVPTPTPVLVAQHEDDGHGWRSVVTYGYRDAWRDPARGEFRGFGEIVEHAPGDDHVEARTVRTRYDLGQGDEARKHLVIEQIVDGEARTLSRETHEYELALRAPGVVVALEVARDHHAIEGGDAAAAARVRTEYDHDEWGNIVELRELGRVEVESGADITGDERITISTFAAPADAIGPRDRPASVEVADGDGVRVSAARFYYDGPALHGLELGALGARGALQRRAEWIADERWIDALRQAHDEHGNVVELLDAEDGRLTRRYDERGRFAVEERLALDPADGGPSALVVTAEWDARFGLPTRVTSPSGASARVVLDGLGRVRATIEPGDSEAHPTAAYEYYLDGTSPPSIVTTLLRAAGARDRERVVEHLDGLGRPRLRVTEDDEGGGAILAEAVRYASDGEPATRVMGQRVDSAALEPDGAATLELDDEWPAEHLCRDALGRAVETTDADGRVSRVSYGPLLSETRAHEDLFSAVEDGRYADTPRRTVDDGLGRTIEISDLLPDRAIVHRYTHDAADRLIAHVDPEGHESRYHHDGVGRLLEIESPDAGLIIQRHDDTGRLLERVDATGASVRWRYDAAGRLLETDARDADGVWEGGARYDYDRYRSHAALTLDDALTDRGDVTWTPAGMLTAVDDDAGALELVYDERGRVIQKTRRFPEGAPVRTLTSAAFLDPQGRLTREVFPDGSTLDHRYGRRGLEIEVPSFVTRVEHDELGRWTRMHLANGVVVSRALDRAGRVLRETAARGGELLRDLTHEYDSAGLLAETVDHVGATPRSPALDQRFRHDDLHRLIAADAAYGALRWRYTDDGNLLLHGARVLFYDGLSPHAVTRVHDDAREHDQRLFYDAAGQLHRVAGPGPIAPGAWRFNAHGRVSSFTHEDGGRLEHVYDHDGARTIRRQFAPGGDLVDEVLYFGHAEVREGGLIRWVFAAGERVAEAPGALVGELSQE